MNFLRLVLIIALSVSYAAVSVTGCKKAARELFSSGGDEVIERGARESFESAANTSARDLGKLRGLGFDGIFPSIDGTRSTRGALPENLGELTFLTEEQQRYSEALSDVVCFGEYEESLAVAKYRGRELVLLSATDLGSIRDLELRIVLVSSTSYTYVYHYSEGDSD